MKQHMVNLWFDTDEGNYVYTGLVTGSTFNGKLVVSPKKIFEEAFHKPFTIVRTITYN